MRFTIHQFFSVAVFWLVTVSAAGAGPAPSTLALQSSANPSTLGQALVLTVTVSPPAATGSVTFYDGVTVLGVATLSSGKAVLSTVLPGSGIHSLKAFYRGDTIYQASTAAALSQTVLALGQKGFQPAVNYGGVINPRGLAVGDFNGDGKPDLVVANFGSNTVSVMLGNGDGSFREPVTYLVNQAPSGPNGIVVGDFNGDGRADLAVVNAASAVSNVAVLLGNGDGTFQTAVVYAVPPNPNAIAMADFNGDGFADLVTANFTSNNISVLLGKGDGTFQTAVPYATGTGPIGIAAGDFNADGRADIVVVNQQSGGVSVLLGKGDGTFQAGVNYSAGKGSLNVAVGDFNGDGRADLAVTNSTDNTVSILMGKGDGTFQEAVNYGTASGPQKVAVGDFNGDGLPDLAVTASGANSVSVLLGNGDGTFQAAVSSTVGNDPIPVAVADFNGDGRADLAVGNYLAGNVSILLGVAISEPVISVAVNGASFAGSGLSPGLIFTLAGAGLGPEAGVGLQLDANGRISNSLSEVQVLVDGVPAPLLFVRQDQINAVAPYSIANKVGLTVPLQVSYKGVTGNIMKVPVVAEAPAIFSLGNGQGAIRNQDQSVNAANNPAARGSFISIYATGEGQTSPAGVDGQLVTDANRHPVAAVSLTIGGIAVVPQFQGSTVFDGFFQVNAIVPQGVAPGIVPVVVIVGGQPSQPGITMAVQ